MAQEVEMAFWDAWFAPKCSECSEKMTGERKPWDDREVCPDCHGKLVTAKAAHDQEVEERRAAEAAAMAKLEGAKSFGGDPRLE
jgi:DNA-directed RNA polymerase subunit RPC12/RpoP